VAGGCRAEQPGHPIPMSKAGPFLLPLPHPRVGTDSGAGLCASDLISITLLQQPMSQYAGAGSGKVAGELGGGREGSWCSRPESDQERRQPMHTEPQEGTLMGTSPHMPPSGCYRKAFRPAHHIPQRAVPVPAKTPGPGQINRVTQPTGQLLPSPPDTHTSTSVEVEACTSE
jgi:hypothetical protein